MSFIILIILSLLFGILAVILLIIAIKQLVVGDTHKNALFSAIGTLFSILFSLVSYMNIDVPKPNIFPLNNDTQTYTGNLTIEITSDDNTLDIYYSIDGTDPKYGELYENSIIISESATVAARTKFLWWWSDISKSSYRFGNIQNITDNNVDNNLNDQTTIEDFLIYLIFFLILCAIVIPMIRRR